MQPFCLSRQGGNMDSGDVKSFHLNKKKMNSEKPSGKKEAQITVAQMVKSPEWLNKFPILPQSKKELVSIFLLYEFSHIAFRIFYHLDIKSCCILRKILNSIEDRMDFITTNFTLNDPRLLLEKWEGRQCRILSFIVSKRYFEPGVMSLTRRNMEDKREEINYYMPPHIMNKKFLTPQIVEWWKNWIGLVEDDRKMTLLMTDLMIRAIGTGANYYMTPLHWAARQGQAGIIKFVSIRDDCGDIISQFQYNYKTHPDIISHDNIHTPFFATPLHEGATSSVLKVVKLLLHQVSRSDASLKDGNGRTAKDIAQLKGDKDMCRCIREGTLSQRDISYSPSMPYEINCKVSYHDRATCANENGFHYTFQLPHQQYLPHIHSTSFWQIFCKLHQDPTHLHKTEMERKYYKIQ